MSCFATRARGWRGDRDEMLFMLCGCAVPSQIGDCFGPLLCTEEPPKEKSAGLVRAIVSMDGLVSKSSPSGGKFSASPDSKGLGRVSIAAMSSEDLPLSLARSRDTCHAIDGW